MSEYTDDELRQQLWNMAYLAWCQANDLSFGLTTEEWQKMSDLLGHALNRLNELLGVTK